MLLKWGGLALVLVLALGLRLVEWSRHDILLRDEIFYINYSKTWNHAEDYLSHLAVFPGYEKPHSYSMPFFPAMLAAGKAFGCTPECFGAIISMTSGMLMVLLGYGIGGFFGRREPGFWLALLIGVNPFLIQYSACIMRDQVYWMLAALCIFLLMCELRDERRNWLRTMLRGLACAGVLALALLLRREALELLVIAALAEVGLLFRRDAARSKCLWLGGLYGGCILTGLAGILAAAWWFFSLHGYTFAQMWRVYTCL